jgi:hypothetical protein
MNIRASLREIVRSAFTELSGSKRLLLRLAVLLVVVGGGAAAWAAVQGELDTSDPGWPLTALASGAACIAGFLAGAAFRACLKLALLVGAATRRPRVSDRPDGVRLLPDRRSRHGGRSRLGLPRP